VSSGTAPHPDHALIDVATWFHTQPNVLKRFGAVIRNSFDEVLDGQRTGRFDINDLDEIEEKYLDTKVKILTRSEFSLSRGRRTSHTIAGHEVESTFSPGSGWSVHTGATGRPCLLVSADDRRSTFDIGLVRITPRMQRRWGRGWRKLLPVPTLARTTWLARSAHLPDNALLKLPQADIEAIMRPVSGQQRINELLRRVHGELIERKTTVTVAMQADGMKRCRDARLHLAEEGIVVLGHQRESPVIARALGLPIPHKGSLLAVRLVRVRPNATGRRTAQIGNAHYAIAQHSDPVEPAPRIHC
jgi:hypothetical protein